VTAYRDPKTDWRIFRLESLVKEPQNHDPRTLGSPVGRYLGLRLVSHRDARFGAANCDTIDWSHVGSRANCGNLGWSHVGSCADGSPHRGARNGGETRWHD